MLQGEWISVVVHNNYFMITLFVAALLPVFYRKLKRGVVAMPVDSDHRKCICCGLDNGDIDIAFIGREVVTQLLRVVARPRAGLVFMLKEARGGVKVAGWW
jgi:hypothetical protein